MLVFLSLVLSVLLSSEEWSYNTDSTDANSRSSLTEEYVNGYMRKSGEEIEISMSMRFLAQLHVDDLELYWNNNNNCNGYHTWSEEGGPWQDICDEDDGSVSDLSEKANELTGYPPTARVYEAVGYIADGDASAWKCKQKFCSDLDSKSKIKNLGDTFREVTWNAMGCGYSKRFCSCWLSTVEDTVNRNFNCSDGILASSEEVCGGGVGTGICVGEDVCLMWESELAAFDI